MIAQQIFQPVARLSEGAQAGIAKGPPVVVESLPQDVQQPTTNNLALTPNELDQPPPTTPGLGSKRVSLAPARPPECVRLQDRTVVANSAVARQDIFKEARAEIIFAVRLVDFGPQHRHMLGEGNDLQGFRVENQTGSEGHQKTSQPASLRLNSTAVPVL